VRLKYGYVIRCTGLKKRFDGSVEEVHAELVPDTKSGTPGADSVKTKGVVTWVGAHEAKAAQVRLYDRLFTEPQPDAGGKDFKAALNPHSKRVVTAWTEPSVAAVAPDHKLQFERHGYFVADCKDHHRSDGQPVFNKITGLKDTFATK